MAHAALSRHWDRNLPAYGGFLTEESEAAIEAYARAGFDYIGLDCQHGLLDETAAARILSRFQTAPFAILTRVSGNTHAAIGKLLDAGSDGVIVPGVDTAEEAASAVSACRYPPHGKRSFGPIRAGLGNTPDEIAGRALCLVMIETRPGLDNVEAICQVPGVSGVYVGPADLSIGLGMNPWTAFSTDQLETAFARIRQACIANSLVLGAHATNAASARRLVAWGCHYVTIGSSNSLLMQATQNLMSELRGDAAAPGPSGPYGNN